MNLDVLQRAKRLRPLVMPLIYTLLTLIVYWRLWTPIHGAQETFKYDPRNEYWGDLAFQYETITDGEIALWNPQDRAGFPLYGDPQPGALYWPNWPIWAVSAVTGEAPYWHQELKTLLHWILGCIGMHLFLRRRRCGEAAAYMGGIIFAFSSPAMYYPGSALNWTYAWIPWVLLCLDWFIDRPGHRRGILLGFVVSSALLSAAPAVFLYLLIVAVPFGLVRIGKNWGPIWKPMATALGVFVLCALPLVLGNSEQVPHSVRAVRDLNFITFSTFPPSQLPYLVLPRVGIMGIYYGVLPMIVLIAYAMSLRKMAVVVAGVFGFGILLSLGHHADVLAASASSIPPFGLFRRAHRFLYVCSAVMGLGMGFGMAYLGSLEREASLRLGKTISWIAAAAAFVIGIGLVVSIAVANNHNSVRIESFALATVSAVVVAVLLRLYLTQEGKKKTWVSFFLAGFLFLDLWLATTDYHAKRYAPRPTTERDAIVKELTGLDEYRIYDRGYIKYRPGSRLGIRDLGGYEDDPLGLRRYSEYMGRLARDPRLMAHANVKYFLNEKDHRQPLRLSPAHGKVIKKGVWEIKNPAPRVYYAPRPRVAKNSGEAIRMLSTMKPGQDAVVESETVPQAESGVAPSAGRITSFSSHHLVAEIETAGPGVIVINEAHYPVWKATVNGKSADIVPANGLFRGVLVDSAGRYRIEMRLRPMRFWGTLPLFLLGLGLTLWAGISLLRERRRATS